MISLPLKMELRVIEDLYTYRGTAGAPVCTLHIQLKNAPTTLQTFVDGLTSAKDTFTLHLLNEQITYTFDKKHVGVLIKSPQSTSSFGTGKMTKMDESTFSFVANINNPKNLVFHTGEFQNPDFVFDVSVGTWTEIYKYVKNYIPPTDVPPPVEHRGWLAKLLGRAPLPRERGEIVFRCERCKNYYRFRDITSPIKCADASVCPHCDWFQGHSCFNCGTMKGACRFCRRWVIL